MKTIVRFILLFAIILFVSSCTPKPIDMLTVINSDGSCYREFSETPDSLFLMGDKSEKHNPFSVIIDSSWQISWTFGDSKPRTDFPLSKATLDSITKNKSQQSKENIVVHIRRNYKSVEELDSTFRLKSANDWNMVKVKHSLEKKFRWFYTYYTYRETYNKLKLNFDIPVEKYMTKAEAQFWFTGKPEILKGMNGLETREYVGKIEDNYNKWVVRNLWNEEFKVVLKNYDSLAKKPVAKEKLETLNDSIYNSKINNSMDFDIIKVLNTYFKTNDFSMLSEKENGPLKKFDEDTNLKFAFFYSQEINYKLSLPGDIIQANNAVVEGEVLTWKLTPQRLIPDDYIIEAQSRKANLWAFILTGLIVIVALGSFFWKPWKK